MTLVSKDCQTVENKGELNKRGDRRGMHWPKGSVHPALAVARMAYRFKPGRPGVPVCIAIAKSTGKRCGRLAMRGFSCCMVHMTWNYRNRRGTTVSGKPDAALAAQDAWRVAATKRKKRLLHKALLNAWHSGDGDAWRAACRMAHDAEG